MRLLFVALFAALALAQLDNVAYTGYVYATSTTFLTTFNSDGTCVAGTSAYAYTNFTHTYTTSGVRYFQAAGGAANYLALYKGSFNPAAPCTNVVSTYFDGYGYYSDNNANDDTIELSGAYFFEANTPYIFLVMTSGGFSSTTAGDLPSSSYAFGINVWDAIGNNATVAGSPTWQAPYTSSANTVSTYGSDSSVYLYATFAYVHNQPSGYYDISAWQHNATADYEGEISLGFYVGTPTSATIQTAPYTYSNDVYFPYENNEEIGVFVYYVYLTQGSSYFYVASTNDAAQTTNFGFFATPSVAQKFTQGSSVSGIFSSPDTYSPPSTSDGTLPTCTADDSSSATGQDYVVATIQTAGNILVVEVSDSDTFNRYLPNTFSGYDIESYIYRNWNNSGSINPRACPTGIPFAYYVGAVDSTPGYDLASNSQISTVVVAPYSGNSHTYASTDGTVVYLFGGVNLNGPSSTPVTPAPATPAPSPSTSTPTTSTPTTSTPTTAGSTVTYLVTVTLTSAQAPGGCANATVKALIATYGSGAVCTPTATGIVLTNTVTVSSGTSAASVQSGAQATLNNYFPGATVTVTQTTAAPTSTPVATTSSAAYVAASFFVVLAASALLF